MQCRLLNIITTYDNQADAVLRTMENLLVEASISLFSHPFEGIIAQINYTRLERIHQKDNHWRKISLSELGSLSEHLEYNIFPLSKQIPDKTFLYIDVGLANSQFKSSGFSICNEQIQMRAESKSQKNHILLLKQIFPDYQGEFFEPFDSSFRNNT